MGLNYVRLWPRCVTMLWSG